jgi:hypothetical protein
MAERQRKAEARAFCLAELQKAEDDLRIAMLQTQGVIDEYSFMSPSDGDFVLDKALKLQHQAMNAYVTMCHSLTKLMHEGAPPDKERLVRSNNQPQPGQSRGRAKVRPLLKNGGAA